ncbi:MAG: HU family DNA-binding protein [Pseudomonadota bacterium]|nr:HU family DNA-binding protein [Pseudomonadota bacterium]
MKKSEILKILENKFDYLPKREVERTLEKILQFFSLKLAKGSRIEIRDFGTFSIKIRNSRIGRNPATGKKINIEKKHFVHFIPGKKLWVELNDRKD